MNGKPWSADELNRLKSLYPGHPTRDVAEALGHPLNSTYRMAHKLALAKSQEFRNSDESGRIHKGHAERGERTRFKKGHVSENKGLRRPGWHRGRMKETQFKKGCRSGIAAKNWMPIGTIAPDPDGYLRIKVREAKHGKEATGFGNTKVWPLLSRYLWEQHKGPIPPKHMVVFKDRDRQHCVIENLELISMADNARRNRTWGRFPRELAEAIQLNGALKRKLRNLDAKK